MLIKIAGDNYIDELLKEAATLITYDSGYTIYPEDLEYFYKEHCNTRMSATDIANLYMNSSEFY